MWCLVLAFGIKAAPSFERSSVGHFIESVDLLVNIYYITSILRTISSLWIFRYITALTDTEEEYESEEDRKVVEPLDELTVLLQRADGLHACNGDEKKEGLSALLERKEKVDFTNTHIFLISSPDKIIVCNSHVYFFFPQYLVTLPLTFITAPICQVRMSWVF